MNNIVQKYINGVSKNFKQYFSIILKSKYNAKITDELIHEYIDLRYYNYGFKDDSKLFYKKIYESLINKAMKMKEVEDYADKKDIIDYTVSLFQYFFYFDFVRNNLSIQAIVEKIQERRINAFGLKIPEDDDFVESFTKRVLEDIDKVRILLISYESDTFRLILDKVKSNEKDYFYATLEYNISFPEIFSEQAIINTFNEGPIAEDKLFVEYPMVAIRILKDLIESNFKKKYIVELSIELLKKQKKLDQLLEVFNSPILQDKLLFKLPYNSFTTCKKEVFALIKKGYNFALITDDKMEKLPQDELNLLKVFACIVADSNDVNIKKYTNDKIIII